MGDRVDETEERGYKCSVYLEKSKWMIGGPMRKDASGVACSSKISRYKRILFCRKEE